MNIRPTQLAFMDGMERPVGRVLPSVFTGTNADLIAAVAPIYLTGSVLDPTYGRGKWWDRFTPDPFTHHDLDSDDIDFRALPYEADSFDAVCFDPPYVPAGGVRTSGATRDEAEFRKRFGLAPRSLPELDALIADGLAECARVTRRWLLVKCTDFVTGSAFVLGHVTVVQRAATLGLTPHDLIVHHTGSGPGGHNITEILRARRSHSYMLVFEKARAGWYPAATFDRLRQGHELDVNERIIVASLEARTGRPVETVTTNGRV